MYDVTNLVEVIKLAHECETPIDEFTLLVEKELTKLHPIKHEERKSEEALGIRDLRNVLPQGEFAGKLSVAVEQIEKTMTKRETAYALVCSIAQITKISQHPLVKMIMKSQQEDGEDFRDE
jgi:hypothetical protein